MTVREPEAVMQAVAAAPDDAQPAGRRLEIDPPAFRANYLRRPFLIPHQIARHPLFSLPRLIELSKSLPPEYVEYNAGNIPISIDSRLTPQNGLSIEETIRRIEENRSWMVLKRVEQDPEYNQLLNECLDEVAPYAEALGPAHRIHSRAGAIFISSPGSVTPYHMDHETNFLLQIRGTKFLNVFDPTDRSLLSEQELEGYFCSTTLHRNLVFKDEFQQKATVFTLTPGLALHVPSTAPHWVKNGPDVSISFSVAYQTPASDRVIALYDANARLRRLGLRPTPPSRSRFRDSLKLGVSSMVTRVQKLLGGSGRKGQNPQRRNDHA
ncbi:MAG: Cupin superfamily protein [Phycisphaerales bacterium]|nr:Cupin superfamily protein [Phycisphaerales bacterium]